MRQYATMPKLKEMASLLRRCWLALDLLVSMSKALIILIGGLLTPIENDGGPVGIDSLAAALSEERYTEDVIEPYRFSRV